MNYKIPTFVTSHHNILNMYECCSILIFRRYSDIKFIFRYPYLSLLVTDGYSAFLARASVRFPTSACIEKKCTDTTIVIYSSFFLVRNNEYDFSFRKVAPTKTIQESLPERLVEFFAMAIACSLDPWGSFWKDNAGVSWEKVQLVMVLLLADETMHHRKHLQKCVFTDMVMEERR